MSAEEMARLRWQCRRGMLELDLLFEAFLERGYADLNESDRALFREFLKETDDLLQPWLLAGVPPERPDYVPLIARIRAAAS